MRARRGAAKSVHARPRKRPRQQKSRKVRPLLIPAVLSEHYVEHEVYKRVLLLQGWQQTQRQMGWTCTGTTGPWTYHRTKELSWYIVEVLVNSFMPCFLSRVHAGQLALKSTLL